MQALIQRFTLRQISIAMSAIILVSLLGACGKSDKKTATAVPADATEVKIGHVAPLTGPIAHLGKDNENGAILEYTGEEIDE